MTDQEPYPGRIPRSVDEARTIILEGAEPLPPVERTLLDALSLTLAEPLVAEVDSPPFATAAMDGFAIRAAEVRDATDAAPVRLPVAGVRSAGGLSSVELLPETVVRIMTGASCPSGADAVVPFEQVVERAGAIEISRPFAVGANLRPRGEDYRLGDPLLTDGVTLTPARLALLAANGHRSVKARPSAGVAVISAGNELREPGEPLEPGQIWDSNSTMIAALCREAGATIAAHVRTSDSEAEILAALETALRSRVDLIITVGGISAGDYDRLKHVLTARGEVELWDVAMWPGRPLAFGSMSGVPVIGLPGNPAAAFVTFHQFARPLLARLMGRSTELSAVRAITRESFQNRGGRCAFIRVAVSRSPEGYLARSAGPQSSASILTLARADGLLVIREGATAVQPGDEVEVQLLVPTH